MLRNRALVPIVLIASLMLPAAAAAGPRHDRGGHGWSRGHHAEDGYITVRNRNQARLEVLVGGRVHGEVRPNDTATFGPFREGRHKVRVRFKAPGLRFPVTVQRVYVSGGPARVDVPALDVGLLKVRNDWLEPMTVVHHGRVLGTVAPLDARLFKVSDAYGRVELRTPRGTTAITKRIAMRGLERDRLVLVPPSDGTVTIVNPSRRHTLDVTCARGSLLARVAPGSRQTIVQPAGEVTLAANYRGATVERATVLSSPWDRTAWTVALPTRSTLGVRNPNRFPVDVFIGGEYLATVNGNDKLMLEGVPVGRISVELVGQGRRGGLSEFVTADIDPLSGGFLPVPEVRITDGRGGQSYGGGSSGSSCDRGTAQTPPVDRRGRGGRGYASNRY